MVHQQINFEQPEEELDSTSSNFKIPGLLKFVITLFSSVLIIACICLTYKYIEAPKQHVSPKELGLNSIFLFSIVALFVVWIPWDKMGIRISKIGGIEFKEIVQEQASEHAEELSYLEDRIESLEAYIRKDDGITELTERFQEPLLREQLIKFLTKYNKWAFSPSRIKAWGSQQQGFSDLSSYEHPFIRSTLQKMVSERLLETRISKKGNTLYRIAVS
ncbi:hypothetical protein [Colwellia psychrerythraea]|uniref:Uncharacterized protein n=1 Tax=Colwellia psychrerythraea TaxID=28229 RepID=A0A099KJL5_COLPS|nr:hypothetical protein [Colwellia psychrerythraea]KGJ90122.1 hypothetical protein ND2E_3678 [Colwellia psychrerythraea]